MKINYLILVVCSVSVLLVQSVSAETTIYKVEKDGKVEYTSKPAGPAAAPAALPKIGHWKLQPTKSQKMACNTHGGINCALGPDSDGSVVCLDGFRDAAPRFKFECTAAKLEIINLSPATEEGQFKLTVRNSKGITAKNVVVLFKPVRVEDGTKLVGPDHIEPFAAAEYQFKPAKKPEFPLKPKITQVILTCENCG